MNVSTDKLCKDCKFFQKDNTVVFMFSSHRYRYGKCTKSTSSNRNRDEDVMAFITGQKPKKEFSFASIARKYHCGIVEAKYWEPKE